MGRATLLGSTLVARSMKPIPIYDESAPIACTIEHGEIPERIELVERMKTQMSRIDRTEHGLMLHLPNAGSAEADARRFAIDEKRCCQFWGFEVVVADSEILLRWEGPSGATDLLDQLHDYFVGDTKLTDISGLL